MHDTYLCGRYKHRVRPLQFKMRNKFGCPPLIMYYGSVSAPLLAPTEAETEADMHANTRPTLFTPQFDDLKEATPPLSCYARKPTAWPLHEASDLHDAQSFSRSREGSHARTPSNMHAMSATFVTDEVLGIRPLQAPHPFVSLTGDASEHKTPVLGWQM